MKQILILFLLLYSVSVFAQPKSIIYFNKNSSAQGTFSKARKLYYNKAPNYITSRLEADTFIYPNHPTVGLRIFKANYFYENDKFVLGKGFSYQRLSTGTDSSMSASKVTIDYFDDGNLEVLTNYSSNDTINYDKNYIDSTWKENGKIVQQINYSKFQEWDSIYFSPYTKYQYKYNSSGCMTEKIVTYYDKYAFLTYSSITKTDYINGCTLKKVTEEEKTKSKEPYKRKYIINYLYQQDTNIYSIKITKFYEPGGFRDKLVDSAYIEKNNFNKITLLEQWAPEHYSIRKYDFEGNNYSYYSNYVRFKDNSHLGEANYYKYDGDYLIEHTFIPLLKDGKEDTNNKETLQSSYVFDSNNLLKSSQIQMINYDISWNRKSYYQQNEIYKERYCENSIKHYQFYESSKEKAIDTFYKAPYNNIFYEYYNLPCGSASKDIAKMFNIAIFPNPSSEILNINFEDDSYFNKLKLVNIEGKVIKEMELELNQKSQAIEVQDIPSGLYLLNFGNNKGIQTAKKIIIRH